MSDLTRDLERLRLEHIASILALIDGALVGVVGEDASLVAMSRYHMSTGGKRLRALLPLCVALALNKPERALLPFAAACEMLHNATLVHDDLQDGDETRRGEPTVWRKFGSPRAINLGDAMLYVTMLLVDQLDLADPHLKLKAMRRVTTETLRVVDGQEREFALQTLERPEPHDYFAMVEGKTSGLFSLPIAGAAELCGADESLCSALAEAAKHLGVIFQIQDDVLDLYGDKGREAPGSDIAEGKISALVVYALRLAAPADASWLRELLRRDRDHVSREEIRRALALFKRCGALDEAFFEIDRRRAQIASSPQLSSSPPLHALLDQMVDVSLAPIASVRASSRT